MPMPYDVFFNNNEARETSESELRSKIHRTVDGLCCDMTVKQMRDQLTICMSEGFHIGARSCFDFMLQMSTDDLADCKAFASREVVMRDVPMETINAESPVQ